MLKKIVRRKIQNSTLFSQYPSILQRIFSARQVLKSEEVTYPLSGLLPYHSLLHIELATERLYLSLKSQEMVVIVGDFDADGATSTAVAIQALRAFGAVPQKIQYLVPNRFEYGYGLTPEIVELAYKKYNPSLIITVDNGISSVEGVRAAKKLGIDVLVTDHHLPGEILPEAIAIINPNQVGDTFPSKNLAGVGVIFYVMVALRATLRAAGWFEERNISIPRLTDLLDYVALGTVADVVPLDYNNRILVHQGLRRIQQGLANPGVKSLIIVAQKEAHRLNASDLGYSLGPRLNAAGRLEDMSIGIDCLLATTETAALEIAYRLDTLNRSRRELETKTSEEAAHCVASKFYVDSEPGVCLYEPSWHQGIVGLVASRMKEKLHRPVIAFAQVDEKTLKGSARSIPGLHIRDVLAEISVVNPELIEKFGGHAMAAGLSLPLEKFPAFSKLFSEIVENKLTPSDLEPIIETDGMLLDSEMNLEMALLLESSGPWGQHFPEPMFDGVFDVLQQKILGTQHLKLLLQAPQTGLQIEAIAFRVETEKWPNPTCERVEIAYKIVPNIFRGNIKVQFQIEQIVCIA